LRIHVTIRAPGATSNTRRGIFISTRRGHCNAAARYVQFIDGVKRPVCDLQGRRCIEGDDGEPIFGCWFIPWEEWDAMFGHADADERAIVRANYCEKNRDTDFTNTTEKNDEPSRFTYAC
jgi:hypothetical protein